MGNRRHKKRMKAADEFTIDRILDGDQGAYALLVNKYKDRVFSLVVGIVRNREVAEELAQDVFVKAYTSLKKFRKEASFSSWLYRIAYNTAISETRKKKPQMQTYEDYLDKTAFLQVDENSLAETNEAKQQLLERALEELPPEEKLILMLYYFEEKSVEEISQTSGLSQSNVKVKLHRMRNKLKEIMERMGRTELAVLYF